MNWIPLQKLNKTPEPGLIKVMDDHGQEAFAHCCTEGFLEIITDSEERPMMDKITYFRHLKECTLKLFML